MDFMSDSLEPRPNTALSSQVSSMVGAAPHSGLIPCKDKLKCSPMHCARSTSKAYRRCDRPRTRTMPDARAEAFRPLLTFLGSIDNLILRRPSAPFSTLVTMHLTSIPGEYMSESEFKSCPARWSREKHTNFTILNTEARICYWSSFWNQNPIVKSCFSVNPTIRDRKCHKHHDLSTEAGMTLCNVSKTGMLCLKRNTVWARVRRLQLRKHVQSQQWP